MVKLKGPIMSLEAHGSIGKILTFSERGSGSQTRKYTKPIKAPSAKQRAQRRLTEFLVAQWQNMTEIQKDVYEDAAKATGKQIAGYHYFLREAQRDLYTHTGLCAYIHCNEIIDGKALDISGQGNHATLKPTFPGDAPTLTASRTKYLSKGLLFNGSSDYAIVSDSPAFSFEGSFSIIITLKPTTVELNKVILTKTQAEFYNSTGWRLGPDKYIANKICLRIAKGIQYDSWASGKIPFTAGNWYHILAVYDDVEKELRIRSQFDVGSPTDMTGYDASNLTSDKVLTIGKRGLAAGDYYNGIIDEICIYNRVISNAEYVTRNNFWNKK